MSQRVQQYDGFHLRQATHPELVQAPVAGVSVHTLGGAGALLVDLLGLRARHALPPLGYLGRIVRTWRVGSTLGVPGGRHPPLHGTAALLDLVDVFLLHEAAVDQYLLGFFLVTRLVLLCPRRHLALG